MSEIIINYDSQVGNYFQIILLNLINILDNELKIDWTIFYSLFGKKIKLRSNKDFKCINITKYFLNNFGEFSDGK